MDSSFSHPNVQLDDAINKTTIDIKRYGTFSEEGRYEYVMVFPITKQSECDRFQDKLAKGGLEVKQFTSRDGDELFLQITASLEAMLKKAEQIEIKKQLKSEYGSGHAEFTMDYQDKFHGSDDMGNFFSSYERSILVNDMIQSEDGAHINIGLSLQRGEMTSCFALHDEDEVDNLYHTWIKKVSLTPPFMNIREYFGEYVAMYFAWLHHYTVWLSVPAAVGSIFFIYSLIVGKFDNPTVPFYAVFVAVWATLYLEYWKRRNSELNMMWASDDFVEDEKARPSFAGEKRYGAYILGEFVELKPDRDYSPPEVLWVSPTPRYFKIGFGLSVLITFLIVVIIATFGILTLRIYMTAHPAMARYGGILAGICNSVTIMILNKIYRKVAIYLTSWENHRTEADYENSYVVKSFAFQFVNSYISLIYIAFMKGRVDLFGMKTSDSQCSPDCLSELTVQLGSIFVTNTTVGQFLEVGLPFITTQVSLFLENRNLKKLGKSTEISSTERQNKLAVYESAFEDYNEMVIQFGYCTLFAAAFPLAPLLAIFNNLIEGKTDAFKILREYQRPHPRSAADIGRWFQILEIMSYAAIVSNSALMLFTSRVLPDYFHSNESSLIWTAIIIEHTIFLLKYVLGVVINDAPKWVRMERARREYWKNETIERESRAKATPEEFSDKMRRLAMHSEKPVGASPTMSLLRKLE